MSNVIKGNFGIAVQDIDLLGCIYEYSGVDCKGHIADKNFSNLSRFSLNQEKAIRFIYKELTEELEINDLPDRVRKIYTEFESMILETMR